MIRIVRFDDDNSVISAKLIVDWEGAIIPILEKYYNRDRIDAIYNKLKGNKVFKPILPDGVYKIEEDGSTKNVYQLTRREWKLVGNYPEIKEEELSFLYDILLQECADEVKKGIIEFSNGLLESLDFRRGYVFDEYGEYISESWHPRKVVKKILEEYYTSYVVEKILRKVMSLVYGSIDMKNMFLYSEEGGPPVLVDSMKVLHYMETDMHLLQFLEKMDSEVNAQELCSKIEYELVTVPNSKKWGYMRKNLGDLTVIKAYGGSKWCFDSISKLFLDRKIIEVVKSGFRSKHSLDEVDLFGLRLSVDRSSREIRYKGIMIAEYSTYYSGGDIHIYHESFDDRVFD